MALVRGMSTVRMASGWKTHSGMLSWQRERVPMRKLHARWWMPASSDVGSYKRG